MRRAAASRSICWVDKGDGMAGARAAAVLATVGLLGAGATPVVVRSTTPPVMHDRDVLVPGEAGSVPPSQHSTDQIPLYDGLTPLAGNVTAADLQKFFKADRLGDTTGRHESVPRSGLDIIRDDYGVPHIFGTTRSDAEFGAGWVAAEDRGFVLQAIRGAGALAALDAPNIDAFGVASNLQAFDESAATKHFLTDEIRLASGFGSAGKRILSDAKSYVAGINAYLTFSHSANPPWTLHDVVGAAALIGAVFGRGGGNQVQDASILADLQSRLGPSGGLRVFNDLRQQQNPNTPTTISTFYSYEPVPTGPTPGSAVVDPGSVQAVSALTPRRHMSNVLLLGPARTDNGHSTAVMGPQVGYFYPEILLEMDLHGGGLNARGASFPGTSLYVEIGRGPQFAWSATSSGSENVDQFLDQLCNTDGSPATRRSDHYLFNGKCRAMTTFDAGYLHPGGGSPGGEVVFHQTAHGPVSGTAAVGGVLYAISTKRSTHGRDVVSALGFEKLNDGTVDSASSFIKAASHIEFTFNWFYVDAKKVAFFSSGRLPIRAPGTNPTLPTLGTGQWEWRGFLDPASHPQAESASAELVNWNNQPAPGWGAASDNWGEGPIDHVLLLSDPIAPRGNGPQNLASAMNQAATQDPRGVLVWPTIARVLASGPAPDARTQEAANLVTAWVKAGGNLLDTTGNGHVDLPGAAIMATAWNALVKADLTPVLGNLWSEIPADGMSYLDQDLRTILGEHLPGAYSRVYCGNGSLAVCRSSLWEALHDAVHTLTVSQGRDPAAWRLADRRIMFQPGVLPDTMRYTNRPTFQQVVDFG
jgi:acyl-homoserine lactone acylase PvdQ